MTGANMDREAFRDQRLASKQHIYAVERIASRFLTGSIVTGCAVELMSTPDTEMKLMFGTIAMSAVSVWLNTETLLPSKGDIQLAEARIAQRSGKD
jgi:hypothetical protein